MDLIEEMHRVEEKLFSGVRSNLLLPEELSQRLVRSGGKRLRPYLMLLCYHSSLKMLGNLERDRNAKLPPRASVDDLHTLASVAEWIHTATLFHDDVLDDSRTRRGAPCAHILHGNKVAILVGDFVYAEAFARLMERGLLEPSRDLAGTIKKLVEGELLQYKQVSDRSLDLAEYDAVAHSKTGSLFGWCAATGAWVAGLPDIAPARELGAELGFVFQMADDLLDTYNLDVDRSELQDLKEWSHSAPPLPLVVAAALDKTGKLAENWGELSRTLTESDFREKITQIIDACYREEVIKECEKRIQGGLGRAQESLEKIGNAPMLVEAVDMIRARADEGGRLAWSKLRAH